jgi:hypothetical protein
MFRSIPFLLGLFVVASACAQDMDDMDNMADAELRRAMSDIPMRSVEEARVSPNAGVMTTVGTTNVMVHYGRPSLRDRAAFDVGAPLAPRDSVWRTGANEAATFTTSKDLMVEGEMLPAGTYGLFTIPGDEWTIIFSQNPRQWGAFRYDAAEDQLRVRVEPMTTAPMQEQFEIRFEDVAQDEATMILHWGTVGVPVVIAESGEMEEMDEMDDM